MVVECGAGGRSIELHQVTEDVVGCSDAATDTKSLSELYFEARGDRQLNPSGKQSFPAVAAPSRRP